MELTLSSTLTLNNGHSIPMLGFGVYRVSGGRDGVEIIRHAIQTGYRHIDTAKMYENEKAVGQAVKESGVPREELFITTKLWLDDHGYEETLRAFEKSRKLLDLDYIDLYLSHWPVEGKRVSTWKAMETLLVDGRLRSAGVSNYMVRHLQEILDSCTVMPAVNQIELHPFNYRYRSEVVTFCRDHNILVEAYSPLTKGQRLDDPVLNRVAKKCGKSPAQILIRWALQHGLVVLPKSARPRRVTENAAVCDFSLTTEQMNTLDDLNEDVSVTWDPTHAP